MPELPEVETIRLDLERSLVGRRVVSATLRDARLLTPSALKQFKQTVVDQPWLHMGRHGKYLWAELANEWRVVFHLRMTGQLVLEKTTPTCKARLSLAFDDGRFLSFYDQRRFGEVWLLAPGARWHSAILPGPDALNELDLVAFRQMLKGRATKIHPLLLDQRRLAGVGNIYAQEALFKAAIRPTRAAKRISIEESATLFDMLRETLVSAIQHRGSTSRNYRDAFGEEGSAQDHHLVYQKGGEPCSRCGGSLRAIRIGGRGAVYCPKCQR